MHAVAEIYVEDCNLLAVAARRRDGALVLSCTSWLCHPTCACRMRSTPSRRVCDLHVVTYLAGTTMCGWFNPVLRPVPQFAPAGPPSARTRRVYAWEDRRPCHTSLEREKGEYARTTPLDSSAVPMYLTGSRQRPEA